MGEDDTREEGEAGAETACVLVMGLLRRKHDDERHVGHAWLRWDRAGTRQYRGYLPDRTAIPEEHDRSDRDRVKYLLEQSVPGRLVADTRAAELERRHPEECLFRAWPLSGIELRELERRCDIPEGKGSVEEGRYSMNNHDDQSDNCSSWAIKVINHVKGDPYLVRCSDPKSLQRVEEEVMADETPRNEREYG